MTDSIYAWSQTAASNSNADASINWAEFQDPDTVNDSARQMMARVAAYISDNAPKRASTGTGNAYAVVSDAAGSSLVNGMVICFIADRANTAAATLNVDGLGAKPFRPKASTEFNAGDLIAGQPVIAWYNSATQEWIALGTGYHVSSTINGLALQSIVALLPKIGDVVLSPDATPAAGRIRLTETTQAVLKTSYPELNTWLSARSYPWGSTATHFNLPPAAGYFLRFAATSTSIDTGGARTAGSTQSDQIKAHTHTGTTDAAGSHSHNVEYANAAREPGAAGSLMSYAGTTLNHATTTAADHTHTFTTASSGGDEVRVKNVAMHADIIASSAESAAQIAVFGFPYQWDTGTSAADPGAGRVRGNNASLGSITQLYINNSDRWAQSLASLWGALASGNPIHLSRVGAQGNRIIAVLNGAPTAGSGFYTIPVSVTVATGSFANNESLAVEYGLGGAGGGGGGGATNLGYTPSPTNGIVTSDTGTDATLSLATGTNAGLLAPADFTKLASLSGTNTGDQSTFGTISVSGQSNVVADTANDTLTLVAGSNITITTNAGTDSITIAAAGGGGSVATDTIWDVKGDLVVGTGSNTASRLAVGTNGQILVADSAEATGLKWAAAAGGGDLLAANNLSDLSNAATARTNLGLAIGTNVQAYDADLTTLSGLAKTDGNFIVGDGSVWTVESGATARASLGVKFLELEDYGGAADGTTDNTTALNNAAAALAAAGTRTIRLRAGIYRFASKPSDFSTGVIIEGQGMSSTYVLRDFSGGSSEEGFLVWANSGSNGGGIQGCNIYAGNGTSSGVLVKFYTSGSVTGYQFISECALTYTGTGTYTHCAFADGALNTTSGSQGIRDIRIRGSYLFKGASGSSSGRFVNATNLSVTGTWANGTLTVTGGGTALSNTNDAFLDVICLDQVFVSESSYVAVQGIVSTLNFSSNSTQCSFFGVVKTTSGGVSNTGTGNVIQDYRRLRLPTSGILDFGGGDVTVTHSSNALAFAGADAGYTFSHSGAANIADLIATHAGSGIKWTHSNTDYYGSIGTLNGGGVPFWALHAEHSSTANTLKNSGAGVKGMYALYNGTTLDFIFNGVATANADFSSTVTGLSMTTAGALTIASDFSNGTSAKTTTGTIELGHASDTTLSRSAAGELAVEGTIVKKVGKETIWAPASAMTARTTNGAAAGTVETTTNKIMFSTLDFDTTTQEFAQFHVRMPKSWDEGSVTATFTWSHASTSTNFGVVWAIEAVALSDGDAGDAAVGTAQQVADTGGTTNMVYITSATSAITIAGSPASEDWVVFQIKRVTSDGSDTMAIDARLHGVTIYFTTNASTDA